MKRSILIAAAVSLFALNALAQDNSADETFDSSDAGGKSAAPGTLIIPSRSANGIGQSNATLNTNVTPLSRITATYLNETAFGRSSILNNDPDASGINRFQLGYKLTDTKFVSIREDSSFEAATSTRATAFHVTDPFVAYTDTHLATLPGDWVLTVQPRVYLPLGESTRFQSKGLGSEALWLILDKSIGKFDIEYVAAGQLYNQTRDSYTVVDSSGASSQKANKDWTAYPAYVEVGYNITEKLALLHDSALIVEAARGAQGVDYTRKHTFYNETYLAYVPTKVLKVMASVENDAVLGSNNAVKMYQDGDMSYNLYLQLRL